MGRDHTVSPVMSRYDSVRINEDEEGVERNETADDRIRWLRSQIIGGDAEFDSPFGKRRLTYADHTASGRCLHYVENYIIKNVLPFYGNTHTSDSHVGHQTTKMSKEATLYIKKCLGGKKNDALIFAGSGTTGAIKRLQEVMGITVPSILRDRVLKCLHDEERWVVFVGPFEHHSNVLSWRQSLAEVIEIGLNEEGLLDMEGLRVELEKWKFRGRPILGSFSACSNVTGICSDTRAIATLLHQYGGFVCFDFAASGPYVKIDMRSGEIDGYDAIFLSPHKFAGGPGSPGILMMSNALYQLKSAPPSTCGGGTVDFVNPFNEKDTLYVEGIEEREDAGTPQIIPKIRAALSFWVKEYIGYEVIVPREENYIQRALDRLSPNPLIWVLGNTSQRRQAILSFLVYSKTYSSSTEKRGKPLTGPFVAKLLNDLFGIQARGGCACAGPYGHSLLHIGKTQSLAFRSTIQMGYTGVKPGWTRISFPYYMSNEEFEFILNAVEFISVYGQRFLPLYHFNWKTGAWSFKRKAFKEFLQSKENNWEFHHTLLGSSIIDLNLHANEVEEYHNAKESKDSGVSNKYSSYLETAKCISSFLLKFPPQQRVPKDINQDLLTFRV
ncbi:hypothetical protein LguiA_003376 [Lonicera macranthoides]